MSIEKDSAIKESEQMMHPLQQILCQYETHYIL